MLADQLIRFYGHLKPPQNLPPGIKVLHPQQDPEVKKMAAMFFKKYYSGKDPRRMMLGINPGRFGAGITGINFTAPRQLKENCGIDPHVKLSSELSAEFIYEVIERYGGVKKFYAGWFIGAVCPLGFIASPNPLQRRVKEKNVNYYDDKKLMAAVRPFIIKTMEKQLTMGFNTDYCICVGGEKNFRFLSVLNDQYRWFERIIPLPHPRFILQYRRKQKENYIHQYLSALKLAG